MRIEHIAPGIRCAGWLHRHGHRTTGPVDLPDLFDLAGLFDPLDLPDPLLDPCVRRVASQASAAAKPERTPEKGGAMQGRAHQRAI